MHSYNVRTRIIWFRNWNFNFFLPPVCVNLWGGFRGFILPVFQLNSPGRVKLPISFCFSFVYRYATRRYTTIRFSKQFAQLIRLYLKEKCFVIFDISLAVYEVKNYFLKLNGTIWNKCLNERTGVEAEGTVGEREIQCESTPRTILETRLCSQSITIYYNFNLPGPTKFLLCLSNSPNIWLMFLLWYESLFISALPYVFVLCAYEWIITLWPPYWEYLNISCISHFVFL